MNVSLGPILNKKVTRRVQIDNSKVQVPVISNVKGIIRHANTCCVALQGVSYQNMIFKMVEMTENHEVRNVSNVGYSLMAHPPFY